MRVIRPAPLDRPQVSRHVLKALIVPVLFLLTACGSSSEQPSSSPAPVSSATPDGASGDVLPEGVAYTVADYAFAPLTVAPGQEVEVVDSDAEAHTLTAIDGSFDTGSFDNSSPGTFTAPDKPGTYDFVCEIHPSMTGTLTVQ